MIIYDNTLVSSLTQSIYDAVNTLLLEYKTLNPLFKYSLVFGTNYDTEVEPDTFGIALQVGSIDRIPTHYTQIDGKRELLFAGTTDVLLNIISPVSVKYLNNVNLSTLVDRQITPDLADQREQNYGESYDEPLLDDQSANKIQDTFRLLEGLSLFMYRKGLIVNNFELSFLTDMPIITGELDRQIFRLTEDSYMTCKFQQKTSFNLTSGENIKLFFNFGTTESPDWEEYHSVVDFSFSYGAVDNNFPITPKSIVQNMINQSQLRLTFTSPAINNIGANKRLLTLIEGGNVESLQNLELKYSEDNGNTFKKTKGNIISLDYPRNIDKFGSTIYIFAITDPIIEEVD